MFGSLEKKLRKGRGKTAPATVLALDKGHSISWTVHDENEGAPKVTRGTEAKDRYSICVQPPGEPTFEATVKISEDDFIGVGIPPISSTVTVLYDPDDHERVAVDVAATRQQIVESQREARARANGNTTTVADHAPAEPDPESGGGPDVIDKLKELADLHDRGALTDEEFSSQKAKLIGS